MSGAKRRVLYVCENERYGGGERAFARLINALDKGRFDVYAACLTGTPESDVFVGEISRAAQVLRLDLRRLVSFSAVPEIRRIVREHGIELVHSQGPRADFYCRLALDGSGVRHVCTVASPVEEYDVGPLRKAVYMVADRFLGSAVDGYVAVAGHIKRKLLDKGAPAGKVRVIYNGVEPRDYQASAGAREKERAALGVEPETFLVAAFSRLSPEKGLFTLLDAAGLCPGDEIKFVVAGAGPLEAGLRARIAELGLEKDFLLAGFVGDVAPLLAAADLVALPSLREGFPMSVLEAMAAGRPVVASRIDGVDESVEDGRTGLLVPPGDFEALAAAVKTLARGRGSASEMGTAGRDAVIARFTVGRMARDHELFYGELLKA